VKRVMQIAEKCIDLRSDSDTSTSTDQTVDRRAVTAGDFFSTLRRKRRSFFSASRAQSRSWLVTP